MWLFELVFHYLTIIFAGDFTGFMGRVHEDSSLLDFAYQIAGL